MNTNHESKPIVNRAILSLAKLMRKRTSIDHLFNSTSVFNSPSVYKNTNHLDDVKSGMKLYLSSWVEHHFDLLVSALAGDKEAMEMVWENYNKGYYFS